MKDYFCLNRSPSAYPQHRPERLSPMARVRLEIPAERGRTYTPRGSAHASPLLLLFVAHMPPSLLSRHRAVTVGIWIGRTGFISTSSDDSGDRTVKGNYLSLRSVFLCKVSSSDDSIKNMSQRYKTFPLPCFSASFSSLLTMLIKSIKKDSIVICEKPSSNDITVSIIWFVYLIIYTLIINFCYLIVW